MPAVTSLVKSTTILAKSLPRQHIRQRYLYPFSVMGSEIALNSKWGTWYRFVISLAATERAVEYVPKMIFVFSKVISLSASPAAAFGSGASPITSLIFFPPIPPFFVLHISRQFNPLEAFITRLRTRAGQGENDADLDILRAGILWKQKENGYNKKETKYFPVFLHVLPSLEKSVLWTETKRINVREKPLQ